MRDVSLLTFLLAVVGTGILMRAAYLHFSAPTADRGGTTRRRSRRRSALVYSGLLAFAMLGLAYLCAVLGAPTWLSLLLAAGGISAGVVAAIAAFVLAFRGE